MSQNTIKNQAGERTQKAIVKYDSRGGKFECWRVIVDGKDFGTGFSNGDRASDCAARINAEEVQNHSLTNPTS